MKIRSLSATPEYVTLYEKGVLAFHRSVHMQSVRFHEYRTIITLFRRQKTSFDITCILQVRFFNDIKKFVHLHDISHTLSNLTYVQGAIKVSCVTRATEIHLFCIILAETSRNVTNKSVFKTIKPRTIRRPEFTAYAVEQSGTNVSLGNVN